MSGIYNTSLGELVLEHPGRSRLLDRLGIDYCSGGKLPLATACLLRGLDIDEVCQELAGLDEEEGGDLLGDVDWLIAPLGKLIDHILEVHHAYLRRELPRLRRLLAKVVRAHQQRHAELCEAAQVFEALQRELVPHMAKEEQILFPCIRQLEASPSRAEPGRVTDPIWVMQNEHRRACDALSRLRWLTGGYATPRDGCASYAALMNGLAELEADLHLHMHKENNILFPRAAELEEGRKSGK